MTSPLLRVGETIHLGSADVPLLGHSNVWVEDSLNNESSICLTQAIIQKALEATAPGQLEVLVFDDGLSGLAAPFWSLNEGGERLLSILNDAQEFKANLRFLRNHVQSVKNMMQGKERDLPSYRRGVNYQVEGYKLVVMVTDVSFLDESTQSDLAVLLKAAPGAGVSFLIHSMTLGANPSLVAMCDHLTVRPRAVERAGGDPILGWERPRTKDLVLLSESIAKSVATTKLEPLAFDAVQSLDSPWSGNSSDGVSFAIGRYGDRVVEVTLGDELNQRHNMLVTGAVGQGKSNLISVIVHSLCQRYSPIELELYLLDFKEGVTLQPFVNSDTGEYLPHARVLGLEADREFGLNVLRHLFGIYKSRMKEFKASGVQNIHQYRNDVAGRKMARIVVVIDEFQMIFSERDKISDEAADLLVRGVRLFRACGIHIILASQTIGGNVSLMGSAGEGLFGQVPVRVALKNSLTESYATLSSKNSAAAHLRAREAIVNQDYGELSANRKTSIAFASEEVLGPLRTFWWKGSLGKVRPPFVFVGDQQRSLADDVDGFLAAGSEMRTVPTVLLGSRIEVDAQPLEVPFGRDIGRNIGLFGQGEAVVETESIVLSLAIQCPGIRVVVLDCLDEDPSWGGTRIAFTTMLDQARASLEVAPKTEVEAVIVREAERLTSSTAPCDTVIVGLGMDRVRLMPREFQDLAKVGPARGVHIVGWWLKIDSFREHVGYGGESFFDVRLALRLDAQSAKQLVADPLLEWKPTANRMLAWDSMELTEATRIIPYSILDPETVRRARA